MDSNQYFATEKPSRLFFRVALPGMVSMLAMSVYSIIEGMFIGHWIGEAAFAAVNIAFPFVMINFSLADLIGVGSSVPISISLGQKDHKKANNIFTCAVIMIFLTAIIMGALLYFGSPALVRLMGAEGELADLAVRYVRVYAIIGPICTLIFAMDNFLRICGFVRGSMLLNLLMTVLTIGFMVLYIAVFGMNVEGSALASCTAMTICACIALIPFLRGKTLLRFVKPHFSIRILRRIVACGSPIFLNNIAGRVAAIVMNTVLLRVGGQTAVAAYSVLMYAAEIINPLMYGLSDSVQPAIGYNWGAGALHRVRDLGKLSFTACGVVSVLGTVLMFLIPDRIALLFVKSEDTALLLMATEALRIFCVAFLVRWFGFAVQGFYSAIEKPLPATILSVASAMVFPLIFILFLWPLGLNGLWLNLAATSFAVSVMALFMLLHTQKAFSRHLTS